MNFRTITLCLLLITGLNSSCTNEQELAETILMDAQYLARTKSELKKNNPELKSAFDQLMEEAEQALQEGPYSVTDKEKLAPSGDRHDYTSYSRYWWPDTTKVNGLPYIRRDGETYPGSQSLKESDRPRIGALGDNTETLSLAYYFTGEQKYAQKVAELVRHWFLNEETLMNPNLNHGQCRLGHNQGYKSGVLDGRLLIKALDGALLIKGSSELSSSDYDELKAWAGEYFNWLTNNPLAINESKSKNNHGSYYDAQAIYFALFADIYGAAKQIAENFIDNRVYAQIEIEGSMPEELSRTRPLFYSMYNLHAMFLVAQLAEQVDVDVWEADKDQSRLRAGLDFIVPYCDPEKTWPTPTIGKADPMEMFSILLSANRVYENGNYSMVIDQLPEDQRNTHRANLAIPTMR